MSLRLLVILLVSFNLSRAEDSISYEKHVRPLLAKHCIKCHNTNQPKANVNIDNYKEHARVVENGTFWLKILDVTRNKHMPPKTEPALSEKDYQDLVSGIDRILQSSLKNKTPGQVVIRRLSHAEYSNTILDLLGIEFNASKFFPSDGSGGGGFDNQGRALFITPLKLERYYDAADSIIEQVYHHKEKWKLLVPAAFNPNKNKIWTWIRSIFNPTLRSENDPALYAEKIIVPFASKSYRKFLKDDEKTKLIQLFNDIYNASDTISNPSRFDLSILHVFKAILISPNFLYKIEEELDKQGPYPLGHFEVANRLSFFLWNSMPDDELFDLAYHGKLQDTAILEAQVKRMLADPKSKRFAETFSSQWLGINKLLDEQPMADSVLYPEFDSTIRKALYKESVEYFYYVLTQSKNLLDLVSSDYSILNKTLARFYEIPGVQHDDFKKVLLPDANRGGVLGMASVLSTTSFPTRTSPVLRGKWVLEQILGTPPPPPPPVVAELTEDKKIHEKLGLRKILELHRSSPDCRPCHEKMDPLGIGLENFDAIGKWRNRYEKVPIDAAGITVDGQKFNGPAALKEILLKEKEKFARMISTKILSYAVGRSTLFIDEPALKTLETTLLHSQFNPEPFLMEVVKSYAFRMKQSGFEKKSI